MTESEPLAHHEYDLLEEALNAAVAVSLGPRGPDSLYDVIGELGLADGALVVDVGCGEGHQAVELATRFSFDVRGVDPLDRRMDAGRAVRSTLPDSVATRLRFDVGTAEAIPVEDATVDMVLCRELLYVVDDVGAALAECRRIAKPAGRLVVYQLFSTESLEPREAEWFWGGRDAAERARPESFEASAMAAGWSVAEVLDLRSETVEWAEENTGKASRELLAAARLLRDPDRYIAQFGRSAYEIKLNDTFWFIYRMIGKLTQRIYVLAPS